MNPRRILIRCPLYKTAFAFIIYPTITGAAEEIQRRCGKQFGGMVNETDLGFLIIIPRPRCPDSWDTVTHETHHLVAKTLARTGVNDEESACYLHGWIINQLLQKLQ